MTTPPPPPQQAPPQQEPPPRRTAAGTRLRGIVLTVIGAAGIIGGVLFAIDAPRYTPVPVVFLAFWLVMVIVGRTLFTGLADLRTTGTTTPAPEQIRGAATVTAIIIGTGLLGLAGTTTGTGTAHAICPGDATCPPAPGPTLTFTPPAAGGGQAATGPADTGTNHQPTATSPTEGSSNTGDNIHAHTPEFGTPGQQAPTIPGNQPPQQDQQEQQVQQGQRQLPVQLTPTQQPHAATAATESPTTTPTTTPTTIPTAGPASSTPGPATVTKSQCPLPGTSGPGNPAPGPADPSSIGPDDPGGGGGAPSWAYLVAEATAVMTGRRRGRRTGPPAGPRNADGSTPTNDMIPGRLIDGDDYTLWTTPDGDRTFILSENADAPSRYRFALDQPPGGSSTINDDGSVTVHDRNGNQVNHFKPPWAYDTITGQKIPTHYSIDGDDLIQTIDRPAGNNNPILADPDPDPDQATTALQKLADQGNPLAQQMAPLTQPAAPDPAQMLQHALDEQEQQSITDAIAQPLHQAQQPELPIDPPYSTPPSRLSKQSPFGRATGNTPTSSHTDKMMEEALNAANTESQYHGVRSSVRYGVITPMPGQGVIRTNLFIPSSEVITPNPLEYGYNIGDNRGFDPSAPVGSSRVELFIDYENGIIVARQNPSSYTDGSQTAVGIPDVYYSQGEDGSVRISCFASDPFQPPVVDDLGVGVKGHFTVTPSQSGPAGLSGMIGSYPQAEVYQYMPNGSVATLGTYQATGSEWGPVTQLPQGINTPLVGEFGPASHAPLPLTPLSELPPPE